MPEIRPHTFEILGLCVWLLSLSFWSGVLYSRVITNADAIAKDIDFKQSIHSELIEVNVRLSRVEGKLDRN